MRTKFVKAMLLTLTLSLASSLMAEEQGVLKNARVFLGIGPSFGTLTMGNLHLGADFWLMSDHNFSLFAGPLVILPFGSYFGGDIDAALKASYSFKLSNDMDLNLYGKASFGISFASIGTGFNLGITPGAEFYFNKSVGVYTELGFLHRSYFVRKVAIGGHIPSLAYTLGIIYRF